MSKIINHKPYAKIAFVAACATVLSAGLNFLYNVLVGRYLGPESFGLLASLMSIAGIITVGTSGFQVATAKEIAKNRSVTSSFLLDTWTIKIIFLGSISMIIFLLISPLISQLLNTSIFMASSICLSGIAAALFSVALGRLQGASQFIEWQIWGVLTTVLKLLGALLLVLIGLSVFFFPISLALTAVLTSLFIIYRTRKFGEVNLKLKSRTVISSSISMTLLWVITQFDIIFARSQFSVQESGLYAAAATISKAIPIAVGLAGAIMLPRITKKTHEGETSNKEINNLALISFVLGISMVVLAIVIRNPLILNLFGDQYSGAIDILLISAVASIPWCVTIALVQARLGSHERQVTYILTFGTSLSIVSAYLLAATLERLILISGITGLIMAIWLLSLNKYKIGVS